MEFSLERDVLSEAVSWAARSLPARPAVPVLSGLRIVASGDVVDFASFDYEVSAMVKVPAHSVTIPGQVVVSGKLLADLASKLPGKNNPVNFKVEGNKLLITCGKFTGQMITMAAEEYPELPVFPPTAGTVDAAAFRQAVEEVSIAATRDETLPTLTGVRMEFEGEKITLMATDRYRLALTEIPWQPVNPAFSAGVLVKARILSDSTKSMAASGPVTLALDAEGSALVGLAAGGRHMTSQLTEGKYPPVRGLFPQSTAGYAVVNRTELIEAVRRVSTVISQQYKLRLSFSAGSLSLVAGEGEENQATEEMGAHLQGEDISITFNYRFLTDGLSSFDTPYVRLSFNSSSEPAVMSGQEEIGAEDLPGHKYLLMPIRVGS